MSCPDWQALCERRQAGPDDGPGWQAALEHLDDCPRCQDDALAADPILLFRRLPALAADVDETEAMKRAVASMRRGETIEHRASTRRRLLLRAAALAAVLLGSVLLRGAEAPPPRGAEPPAVAALAAADLELEWLPLVETVDPSYGSIIQLIDDGISVVVVLPAGADGAKETDADVVYPDA